MKILSSISLCLLTAFSVSIAKANSFVDITSNLQITSPIPPITLKESVQEFSNLPEGLTINYKKAELETAPARLKQMITPLIDAYTLYLLNIDGKDINTALQNHIIKKHKAGEQTQVNISCEILYQSDYIFSLAIHAYILKGDAQEPQVPHTWIINYDMKENNLIQRKNLFKVAEGQVLKKMQSLLEQGLVFDEKGSSVSVLPKALVLPEQIGFLDNGNLLFLYQPNEIFNKTMSLFIAREHLQTLLLHK